LLYKLAIMGPIEDVYDVRVLEWHGAAGRVFVRGNLMVELETHKAVIEVRANQYGILRQIFCRDGEWQKLGEPLAILSDTLDETLPANLESLAAWEATFEVT